MIIQPTLPGNHPEDLKCLGGNSNNNNFLAACPPNTMNKRCQCATRSFLLVYPATPRGMYPRDSEDLGVERNNNKYLLVMWLMRKGGGAYPNHANRYSYKRF